MCALVPVSNQNVKVSKRWYAGRMGTVVNLDPDVEELLRREARERNVDFDRALNDAIRAGLVAGADRNGQRFVQKTYSLGSDLADPKKVLAELDELEDQERLRKMRLAENR